ncbi:MAG: beta-lactamase family protein [Lachnospiraceae bacterium]|nr:beta-lactamase family protein [Lachnospiraceae bacterium]
MKDKLTLVKEAMDRAIEAKEVAGVSLLVLKDGKETLYAQSGHSDIAGNIPMNRDVIVHLYSQSKPITAAAAMLLMQDGLIDLNEPVEKYLESFRNQQCLIDGSVCNVPDDRKMRIVDLLNMTSGLVYPGGSTVAERETCVLFDDAIKRLAADSATPMMTTMEFADRIGRIPLQFIPGTRFQYGTSADVLGALIERVSGQSFGDFLKERLFDPLDMVDTGFFVPESKRNRLSKVYAVADGEFKEFKEDRLIIRSDGKENAFESGGAGLFSTLDDYAHFGQMLINNGTYNGKMVMNTETVRFMTTSALKEAPQHAFDYWNGLDGYTYANLMRVLVRPEQAILLGHKGEYGWDGWLGAYFMNDPETRTTILMFTQMTDYGTGYLTRKLRNIVLS